MAGNGDHRFPRIRLERREISHERQIIQVGKVTPATPTLGVSRVFESFEMGSQGRLRFSRSRRWGRRGDFGPRTSCAIPILLIIYVKAQYEIFGLLMITKD